MSWTDPEDTESKVLKLLYWASWTALWLFVAILMLSCIFGGILYTWQG